jgi:hypothetical protein
MQAWAARCGGATGGERTEHEEYTKDGTVIPFEAATGK